MVNLPQPRTWAATDANLGAASMGTFSWDRGVLRLPTTDASREAAESRRRRTERLVRQPTGVPDARLLDDEALSVGVVGDARDAIDQCEFEPCADEHCY